MNPHVLIAQVIDVRMTYASTRVKVDSADEAAVDASATRNSAAGGGGGGCYTLFLL